MGGDPTNAQVSTFVSSDLVLKRSFNFRSGPADWSDDL